MTGSGRAGCLIAIAGAIGSGKSTIAEAVSRRLAVPVHSLDDDKRRVGASHPDFETWVADGTPFPDEFRRRVYDRALEQLARLATTHPQVIVEETFHRADIRDPFFRSAEELFGSICVIEIVVSPEVAIAHLEQRARREEHHMAGKTMFEAFARIADPIDADLVVENNGDLDSAVDAVCRHLASLPPSWIRSPSEDRRRAHRGSVDRRRDEST